MVIWPVIKAVRKVMGRRGLRNVQGWCVTQVLRWERRMQKKSGRKCMFELGV